MEFLDEIESSGQIDSSPHVDMDFDMLEDAWKFWKCYGGKIDFDVRKTFRNERTKGRITSRGFVCAASGYRELDKRNREVKRPRAETRTGCPVRLYLKLIIETQKYRVYDFCGDHNHALQQPEAIGLMPSQREIPETYVASIDLAYDSGIPPREGYELMGREAGGSQNLLFSKRDYANHLRDKRSRNLACGEAASMLRYFYNRSLENWSFKHTEQLDKNGQIMNVFWADAKMLIDYAKFGDVITFDTTYVTNKHYRPLGVFVGFNHFREIVVFGATLLYEELIESFKWLFETFLATHNNKHPKTIFTDQDRAMATVLKEVMSSTYHGLCTWHISQNALKSLTGKKKGKKDEADMAISGKEILKAFRACMYEYSDVDEFDSWSKWSSEKVATRQVASGEGIGNIVEEIELDTEDEVGDEENEECVIGEINGNDGDHNRAKKIGSKRKSSKECWLNFIFEVKEKWAEYYMKDVVLLGMRSTQLSESFNKDLKSFLKWNMDMDRFFNHFERVLVQKREKEIESEYEMRKKKPRLNVNIPILQQVSTLYTLKIFENFQDEWELSMASFVKLKDECQLTTKYTIAVSNFGSNSCLDKCFQVSVDHTNKMVSCSCNKFKRWGVLCGHSLKVLNIMDIKLLPEEYILKRWTRAARSGMVEDFTGRTVVENPKLDATCQYRSLARKPLYLATKAADFEEVSQYVDSATDVLNKKVDELIQKLLSAAPNGDGSLPLEDQSDLTLIENVVENSSQKPATTFKRKTGRKGGRRLTSWVDKQPKRNKENVTEKKEQNKNNGIPLLQSEPGSNEHVNSFMELLMGGSSTGLLHFSYSPESASVIKEIDLKLNHDSTCLLDEVKTSGFTTYQDL